MAHDLETMRQELYEAFNLAIRQGKQYSTSSVGPELLKAAAEAARAITAIETEQRAQDESTKQKPELVKKTAP